MRLELHSRQRDYKMLVAKIGAADGTEYLRCWNNLLNRRTTQYASIVDYSGALIYTPVSAMWSLNW